jgi:hypothetical protein
MGSVMALIGINPAVIVMCPARIKRCWTLMVITPTAMKKISGIYQIKFRLILSGHFNQKSVLSHPEKNC